MLTHGEFVSHSYLLLALDSHTNIHSFTTVFTVPMHLFTRKHS